MSTLTSFVERLRSLRHGFWYRVSERVRWSRGTCREEPALGLAGLAPQEAQRIAALRQRYQPGFETQLNAATSRRNYEYLDILDRAWRAADRPVPGAGGILCDVGCASFWYAQALQAFFRPASLSGVDIEGYRLMRDGHTRYDLAAGYVSAIPGARFIVADYSRLDLPADVVTAWFPFLTPAAILAWRLPLRLLEPAGLFAQVARNLRPGGRFVMVNHGPHEASIADRYCAAAGLVREFEAGGDDAPGPLSSYRAEPPVLSCWHADISLRY